MLAPGKPNYSKVEPCRCQKQRLASQKMARLLMQCELPEDAQTRTLENFVVTDHNTEAFAAAVSLAEEDGEVRWLTLAGEVNRGKTHLLLGVCQRWLARGRAARYAYVPLLLDELRAAYAPGAQTSYEERFRFFCTVPLLALDDLGVQNATEWVREKLDTLVDYRYIHGLPLLVTMNKTLLELPVRLASRLQRAKGSRILTIGGPGFEPGRKERLL